MIAPNTEKEETLDRIEAIIAPHPEGLGRVAVEQAYSTAHEESITRALLSSPAWKQSPAA